MKLAIDSDVLSTPATHVYTNPPNVGLASQNYAFSSTNAVGSLNNTLAGITLTPVPAQTTNLVGLLADTVSALLGTVTSYVLTPIISLLSSLVDPLINSLLSLLGIDLATLNVGANLTCQTGRAQLVL